MATASRQYGRRGTTTNTVSSDSGAPLSPSSTASTTTPPRRYVLDVPTGRTSRSSTARNTEGSADEANTRSGTGSGAVTYSNTITTDVNNDESERLSRSGSREYYYRDSGNESSSALGTRYLENSAIRQLIESGNAYGNNNAAALEDQEVQALTAQATPDVRNYPINVDHNPELIVRPNTQRLTYTQDIAVRYLKPSTPPPPGPIIIREIRAPAPPPAPPIILRQRPPPPRTPSPVIIREKPPARPKSVPTTVIKKVIPPPPPPPRKLIIERLPTLPPKPRPVIIERWLPYHKQKRQVIHEKAKPLEPRSPIKNTIIEWRPPEVEVVKHVKKLGVQQADPQRYYTQHGDKLYATEFVQRKLTELGLQEELALMQEQQRSISQEETAMDQADEANVRQIMNSPTRQNYSADQMTSLGRSSSTGGLDGYYDGYTREEASAGGSGLTEEMLLRSYSNSGGRFPTHLLTKLGSQVYDMPSDQVDMSNNSRRSTSTTRTTRYYSVNQGEQAYESAIDEARGGSPRYGDERYVQLRASDLNEIMANSDAYNSRGEKLEGEELNY